MAEVSLSHVLRHLRTLSEARATRDLSDGELLERFCIHREETTFALLVQRHGPMVLGVCRRMLADVHAAEDAFQATFLVLVRKAASIRKRDSVASWLHGVARRIAIKARLRTARDHALERRSLAMPRAEECDELTWHELRAVLDEELEHLPEKYRTPLVLCGLEGKTHDQAARELGCPKSSLSSRLARARELLRARLTRRGITVSAVALAAMLTEKAPAAVPALLTITTVQAAMRKTGEAISANVATLTEEGIKAMGSSKAKAGLVLVLLAGMAVAVSAFGYQLAAVGEPMQEDAKAAAKPVSKDRQPKTDLHGDPLPDEAIARLGTQRFWCGSSTAIQVAYSRDGTRILVANWYSVYVLDAATGKQLRQIRPAGDAGVNSMSLSPDGKLLALGTDGHTKDTESSIQIFDMQSGRLLRQCKDAGRQQYLDVHFSPDGKLLASSSYPSKIIYLWDAATAQEVRRWPVTCETFSCLAFSGDSKTLIVGDRSTIHFWNVATGTEARRIEGHPGVVYQLALSPDGQTLASRGLKRETQVGEHERDNKLYVWDTSTGKKRHQIEIVPEATRQAKRLGPDASAITHLAFAPDGKSVVTASGDGILRVWDPTSGKELRRWDTAGWAGAFAFAPDGKTLASLGASLAVRLWDPATGKELREHPGGHHRGFGLGALSPDGRMLASGGGDVRLWDTASGQLLRCIGKGDEFLRPLYFSRDGRLLTTINEDKNVQVWDVASGKEVLHFAAPLEGYVRNDAISADGKICASDSEDRRGKVARIVLWDSSSGKKLRDWTGDEGWIGALALSQDGRMLYSWGWEKKVRIWDVAAAKLRREFPAGPRQCYSGKFSPDGKWFACKSREDGILLYDLASGREAWRFKITGMDNVDFPGPDFPGLAFSPGGCMLGVGDTAGTIHLVELATGKVRHRFTGGLLAGIVALVFSADGERLISGSGDTTALVWDLTGRLSAKRETFQSSDFDAFWTDLVSDDAARAYQAMRQLMTLPAGAVTLLSTHLHPIAAPDAKRLASLFTDLDSDAFATRHAAMKELAQLGELAAPALRAALDKSPSPEALRRIDSLLDKLKDTGSTGELLRSLRATEVLEHIATPEARQLLQKLADGAPEARLTREAKAALERLERRQSLR